MTERERPLTARERAMFDAATQGQPDEFVRLCERIGRDPREMLDDFDAEPWRWLIVSYASSGLAGGDIPSLDYPPNIRARLDATRQFLEKKSWWRRLAGRRS